MVRVTKIPQLFLIYTANSNYCLLITAYFFSGLVFATKRLFRPVYCPLITIH
jgi:hypothetical protein